MQAMEIMVLPVNLDVVMVVLAGQQMVAMGEMVEYQAVEAGEEQLPITVLDKAVLVVAAK